MPSVIESNSLLRCIVYNAASSPKPQTLIGSKIHRNTINIISSISYRNKFTIENVLMDAVMEVVKNKLETPTE